MGFNIGRFLGSIAKPILGAVFGPLGGVIGGGVGAALAPDPVSAATLGRTTLPGPFSNAAPLPNPFLNRASFAANSILPTPASFGLGRLPSILGGLGTGLALEPFMRSGGQPRNPISEILAKARQATGGPVTRNKIIEAAKACGLEVAGQTFGLDIREVCLVVVKGRTRRRRGVSAADIRRTKRTIGFASRIRKDLKALAR